LVNKLSFRHPHTSCTALSGPLVISDNSGEKHTTKWSVHLWYIVYASQIQSQSCVLGNDAESTQSVPSLLDLRCCEIQGSSGLFRLSTLIYQLPTHNYTTNSWHLVDIFH